MPTRESHHEQRPTQAHPSLILSVATLIACILIPNAFAQTHTQSHDLLTRRITITADTTTLTAADTITLTIRDQPIGPVAGSVAPDSLMLNWAALRDAIEAALPTELRLTEGPTPLPRDPAARSFLIEPLTPGNFTIPSLQLTLTIDPANLPDLDQQAESSIDPMSIVGSHMAALEQQNLGNEFQAGTEPITLTVRSVFADDEDPSLADLRGIVEPRWPFPWRTTAIAAAALLITGALTAYFIAAHRKRSATRITTITADALAHQQLQAVLAHGDLEAQRYRLLLERVSAVLRGYLEDRFQLRAPQLTTAEFLREAESSTLATEALTPADRATIAEFLNRIDMIKFAGVHASHEDAERAIDAVRDFIDCTASPEATIIIQRGKTKIQTPGSAARLLQAIDQSTDPALTPNNPGGASA